MKENITHIVIFDVLRQILETIRVQIVGEYSTALLSSRQSKRANASKHIGEKIVGRKKIDETVVFTLEPRVPVHL